VNTEKEPYNWAKTVESALLQRDDIPMLGGAPTFPWKELSVILSRIFDRENLQVEPSELHWRSAGELLSGMGKNPKILHFVVTPLEGQLCWIMAEPDLVTLSSHLFSDSSSSAPFKDMDFLQGFHYFLATEVMHAIDSLRFLKRLTPRLSTDSTLPSVESLCLDVSITVDEKTTWGRLVVSPSFLESWKQNFAPYRPTTLSSDFLAAFDVTIGIEVGKTELSLEEWSKVRLGDFLVLDNCSLDPDTHEGAATLTVNGHPTFQGTLKGNTIELQGLSGTTQKVVAAPPQASEASIASDTPEEEAIAVETPVEARPPPQANSPSQGTDDADLDDDNDDDFDDDDFDFDDDDDDFDFDDDDDDDDDDFD
jgi:flagellar motor switch protein FliN/FliY